MPEVTRAPVHIGMRAMRPRHAAYMRVAAFDPAANPSKNVARPIARPLARRSRSADPHKPRKAGGPRAVSATAPSPPPPRARASPVRPAVPSLVLDGRLSPQAEAHKAREVGAREEGGEADELKGGERRPHRDEPELALGDEREGCEEDGDVGGVGGGQEAQLH